MTLQAICMIIIDLKLDKALDLTVNKTVIEVFQIIAL